ncbi:MAG: Rrf2 family transcriptional regulator [Parvibaculaceae bacterium]|nr:Rrf2 family transcriptional regulator [Parvibaculaceae bacterium]
MLSQKAKYALKAMLALSGNDQGSLLQAAEIAEQQNIPRKFLELILLELRKHGFVHSHRGKNGGYTLAKPADTITFGQIIRVMDGPLAALPCASLTGYRRCGDCQDEKSCAIRKAMREVRDSAALILDNLTLQAACSTGAAATRALVG